MPEVKVDVEIELYCNRCGDGICGNGVVTYTRHRPSFRIDPCRQCLKAERQDGYEEGYEAGGL